MRSERSPEPTIDLRAPARSLASRSRSSSNSRVRSTFSALALFLCCDFSSCWMTTRPVGRWVMRTALSVVLTDWPPGPDAVDPALELEPREAAGSGDRRYHFLVAAELRRARRDQFDPPALRLR